MMFKYRSPWQLATALSKALLLAVVVPALPASVSAAPADDLAMKFSSKRIPGKPGNITGTVTNRSNVHYPCVDAVFYLSTHFEDRQKGLPVKNYGDQSVRILNIEPRSAASFSAPLLRKAGFGFRHYELCADSAPADPRPPAPPTPPVEEITTCDITGRVGSDTKFEGFDDRGQREVIEKIFILDASTRSLVTEVSLKRAQRAVRDNRTGRSDPSREFSVSGLPADRSYVATLSAAWRTDPQEIVFRCPKDGAQRAFAIGVLFHTGNQLGG